MGKPSSAPSNPEDGFFYPLDQLGMIQMPAGVVRQICTLAWIIKSCFQQQICIPAIGSLQVKIVFLSLRLITCVFI